MPELLPQARRRLPHLYLSTGYQPQFDVRADPETVGILAFTKDIPAAAQD